MHLTSEAEGRTEDVPGAILTREKSRRMDRETASEMASLPRGQNNAWTGMFLKLFVHKKHN